ncbi:hypothetical protein A2962_01605 [Candidatus Woesebacteria bacterium RIFCSPLOWO2_01_FULL_39_61]|nr:MAG: hypothetical protein A2962_01605 [Candidatus Woesebacteria bacterium RIFCSPLOWO2_01_FULL_39_61]
MSDGPEGEGRPDIKIATTSWEPSSGKLEGKRYIGNDPDSERMDAILGDIEKRSMSRREYIDRLQEKNTKALLFEGGTLSDEKKLVYREVLEKATIGALHVEFRDSEKLMGIIEEINREKAQDPNESLFLLIQNRLLGLVDTPSGFTVNGQNLTDDEVAKAVEGLKFARDEVLVQSAKAAGIFRHTDPVSGEVRGINVQIKKAQMDNDYIDAMDVIGGLGRNASELHRVETRSLNRSTVDFGGMSSAYIGGALDQMEFHLAEAQLEYYPGAALAAEAAGDTKTATEYRKVAEEAKLYLDRYGKTIDLERWGKERPQLKKDASDFIQGKGKYRKPEVATGGAVAGDALLEQLKKMADFTEGQYRMAVEQNRALLSGYEAVVHAMKHRAFTNPEGFDSSNPYWFRFEQRPDGTRISNEDREKYQDSIRLFLQLNYLSYIKELTGAKTSENWIEAQGARLSREYFREAWDNTPGFRMAVLTLAKDVFQDFPDKVGAEAAEEAKTLTEKIQRGEFQGDELVKVQEKVEKLNFATGFNFKQFVLSETGYQLLSDKKNLDAYRKALTKAMSERLSDQGLQKSIDELESLKTRKVQGEDVDAEITKAERNLENHQKEVEEARKWATDHRVTVEDLIQTSVHAADDLFYATGAYDSGDVYRAQTEAIKEEDDPTRKDYAIKLQESATISDGVRELFSPGLKLKERLSARKRFERKSAEIKRIREDVAAGRIAPDKLDEAERKAADMERTLNAERAYGGPLGEWTRENYSVKDRKTKKGTTFREEFDEGERDYIPERMFYSVLEMIDTGGQEYADPQTGERSRHPSTSIADVLIDKERYVRAVPIETAQKAVIKFEKGQKTITKEVPIELVDLTENGNENAGKVLDEVRAGEWWGYYWDVGSAVVALEGHQMSGDPKKRLSRESFLDKWIKVRGDAKLAPIFTDRAYLLGATALIMSPEKGFVTGQAETILDIPESAYNAIVTSVLSDNRFFMSPERRKQLYDSLHARDVLTSDWNLLYDIYIEGTLFAPRERSRRGISKKMAKEIEAFEEEQRRIDEEKKKRRAVQTTTPTP